MRAFIYLLIAVVGLSSCGVMKDVRGKLGSGSDPAAEAPAAADPAPADGDAAETTDGNETKDEASDTEPRPVDRPEQTAEAKPEETPEPAPAAKPKPDPNASARASCLAKGGTFQSAGGSGARTCVTRTRDANNSCSASSQCEGMCLARSGTCSPITPLSGCHDIVTNGGNMATVCLD